MTYKKLYEDALFKLDRSIITLGEFGEMTKPLDREVEQEPTDKNFTKADIDAIVTAINAHWELILDEIRAEIEELDYITFDGITKRRCLEIIDKYKAENNL
jgi:hypothetical protein